ncbi:MAG TPA: NAD(P)-dependent oxidoreductase [Actinomycetes bacterium]
MTGRPVVAVLGTRYRDLSVEEEVLGPLGVELVSGDGGSAEDVLSVAGSAEVVLAGSRPRFDESVLAGLTCRGIVRYGIGTDTIDLDAARRQGIAVARVSDYGTEAVAFHTVSLVLALLRRLREADRAVRAGEWGVAGLRPLHLPSRLTAGVVGYGRIGRQTATYLRGLGLTVCAFDEYVDVPASDGVEAVPLDDLLERSDVVTLHAPGSADGTPVLDRTRLARMRSGSVLVNTARGSLVDVPALVRALAAGRPAAAALDVYPAEPPDVSVFDPVADRVLLTPHMAWYTEESELDMRRKAAEEAARMLRGEPLRDPVVETGVRAT